MCRGREHAQKHLVKCMQCAVVNKIRACRNVHYHHFNSQLQTVSECSINTTERLPWTVSMMFFSVPPFPRSSKEFTVRSGRSGGLCSHVARERLILCAHSACRQTAGHNSSTASNNTTTHTVPSLSGSAALALASWLRIRQGLIPADKSFPFSC